MGRQWLRKMVVRTIPVKPSVLRSQSTKWLSVPPVTNLHFLLSKADAKAWAFFLTCWMYALYSGVATCFRVIAKAAIWLLWGPPCIEGKTPKFILSSKSYSPSSPWEKDPPRFLNFFPFLKNIIPPLGPLRFLWVVDVTTSQYSKGLRHSCKGKIIKCQQITLFEQCMSISYLNSKQQTARHITISKSIELAKCISHKQTWTYRKKFKMVMLKIKKQHHLWVKYQYYNPVCFRFSQTCLPQNRK